MKDETKIVIFLKVIPEIFTKSHSFKKNRILNNSQTKCLRKNSLPSKIFLLLTHATDTRKFMQYILKHLYKACLWVCFR